MKRMNTIGLASLLLAGATAPAAWSVEEPKPERLASLATEKPAGVAINQPAADAATHKARIAVLPALLTRNLRSRLMGELQDWGFVDLTELESTAYSLYLVDALVNTHKMDVMERERLRSALRELDFGESDYGDHVKSAKIGTMLNADYVVLPEIIQLRRLGSQREVPYVGTSVTRFTGVLTTLTRVVEVRSSRIIASHKEDTEVQYRPRQVQQSPRSPGVDLLVQLYSEDALKTASSIVDTAYPIKVLAVTDNTCVLNRGEGAIREGELLNVYQTGEALVDPDTKEQLGYQEKRVGQIKVIKVDAQTAVAAIVVIVAGADKIGKLNIARRDMRPPANVETAPAANQ